MSFPSVVTFPPKQEALVPTVMINVEKLSLPTNTTAGFPASVSDGFKVSGFGDADINGFFYPRGSNGGKPTYFRGDDLTGNSLTIWTGSQWFIQNTTGDGTVYSIDDVAFPWLVTTWLKVSDDSAARLTLTHPAIQELASPSTAITGEFVTGVGVCVQNGTSAGKPKYPLVGTDGSNVSHDGGIIWETTVWKIYDSSGGDVDSSVSDTARPDQATWPSATVTALTTGQLGAGLRVGSTTFQNQGATSNGRFVYHDVLGVAADYYWTSSHWTDDNRVGLGDTAFPWEADWSENVDPTPAVQDDVANEANWTDSTATPPSFFPISAHFA